LETTDSTIYIRLCFILTFLSHSSLSFVVRSNSL